MKDLMLYGCKFGYRDLLKDRLELYKMALEAEEKSKLTGTLILTRTIVASSLIVWNLSRMMNGHPLIELVELRFLSDAYPQLKEMNGLATIKTAIAMVEFKLSQL